MQSLITSLSQQNGIAKLYSTISVIETIGSMISHPVLAGALTTGIRLGGWSLGLPFFVCAVLLPLTLGFGQQLNCFLS
jgi:hypothetical protein